LDVVAVLMATANPARRGSVFHGTLASEAIPETNGALSSCIGIQLVTICVETQEKQQRARRAPEAAREDGSDVEPSAMNGTGTLACMGRRLEFGRHISFPRRARRLELQMKRALRDRLGPIALPRPGEVAPAESAPLPLFTPRAGPLEILHGVRRFTFLNRTIQSSERVAWDAPGPRPHDQLWRMCLHYMEYLEALNDAEPPSRCVARQRQQLHRFAAHSCVERQLALHTGRLPSEFVGRALVSPRHVWRFEVTAGAVAIHDRVEGCAGWAASIAFLHPACEVSLTGGKVQISRAGVAATLRCTTPLCLEPGVWWPDMGVE
jgi:hypothetical protein